MQTECDKIRNHLKLVMELEPCGLRGLEEMTGVSFSTLSRFIRGAEPNIRTLRALEGFVDGKPKGETKPIAVKRFKVSGKTFIVEIRELP